MRKAFNALFLLKLIKSFLWLSVNAVGFKMPEGLTTPLIYHPCVCRRKAYKVFRERRSLANTN